MLFIVIPEYDDKLISSIEYIFLNQPIKKQILLQKQLINILNKKKYNNLIFIFINSFLNPINNFVELLNNINYNFCYLSENKNIFYIKQDNITINSNIIDIKKENNKLILFENDCNIYDHIIPPDDINNEYMELLKKKNNYDSIINFKIAYKSYEKFLKYEVKDNYCYNIILLITDINQLNITLPIYNFYRITLFHTFLDEDKIRILKSFCIKNKIISFIYLGKNITNFICYNNIRSIWFEKVVLLDNINLLNIDLINKLNKYHKIKKNIIFQNLVLSIDSSDFVCIPFFNKINNSNTRCYNNNTKSDEFNYNYIINIIRNYIYNNVSSLYSTYKPKKNIVLKFKKLDYIDKLMITRNYNLIIDELDLQIKNNYDFKKYFQLIIKKTSLAIMCKTEEDLIKELNIIIQSTNNLEFLTNLVFLFDTVKNKKVMNKLYIKILELTQKNKFSPITCNCFQKLLAVDMNEVELIAVLDFIIFIKSKNNEGINYFTEENIKKIILTLFLTVSKHVDNKIIMNKFNNIINDFYNLQDLLTIDKIIALQKNNTNNICLIHFLLMTTTNFTPYYSTLEECLKKRQEIKLNLENLLSKNLPTCNLKEVLLVPVSNFYLSYQGIPSVEIFKLKSKLIRKICPDLNYSIDTNFKNDKINICFHANFLTRWHSVFKDRHQIIKKIADDNRFNVYYSTYDDLTEEVKYLFGEAKHIKITSKLSDVKNTFEKLKLDVLVFCEIGMDPITYFIAHMRLARIQINTWGHSDSSGIDTIDYFYSSELYELPFDQAQLHYSEKLILQKSLCTCYVNPSSRYNINLFKNRYHFGFSDDVILYFCAQSLFKFNPMYDDYIIKILQNVDNSCIILLDHDSKADFIKRFDKKNIVSKFHFVKGMAHHDYLNLINICDVILDPYPFGGCNSSLEAFSLNKIVVTQSSDMINGRFTSGFYKKMKLNELICYNKDKYIKLATKLGNNLKYKKEIEQKIKDNNKVLFNDNESVYEWINNIYNSSILSENTNSICSSNIDNKV